MKVQVIGYQNQQDFKITEKATKSSIQDLKKFFNTNLNFLNVYLVYSRAELDRLFGFKTREWMVASAGIEKDGLGILAPSVIERYSKLSQRDFPKLIKHELVHRFIPKIAKGFFVPKWLDEGTAIFLANQVIQKLKPADLSPIGIMKKLDTNKHWRKHIGQGAYNMSGLLVEFLVKHYGSEELIRLLGDLPKEYSFKEFAMTFSKVFNQTMEQVEEEFNYELGHRKW